MTERKPFQPRHLTGTQWFWFLAFMGLVTRLPLLRLASAETTDGVLCLNYFSTDMSAYCFLPGYPALLRLGTLLGLAGGMWGRFLAAAAGLLFLIPLWKFARRWVSVEMAGMICLMALFSPLLWQWSLKVMPDTLFLFLFWWCLERLTTAFMEGEGKAWAVGCLAGVLSALVRAEGFLTLPWVVLVGLRILPPVRWKKYACLLVLWAAPFYFFKDRFFTILSAYQEGLGLTQGAGHVSFPFLNLLDHLYAYLTQPVYVFTPLVFGAAILGLAKMTQRGDLLGEGFRKIMGQIYVLLFLSRLVPTLYQDRHLLPFLPLLLVAAGYQLETYFHGLDPAKTSVKILFFKNGFLTLCLAWLALYSAAVLISQCDSFGDIRRCSEFVRTLPAKAVLYSDEVPKTQYWSDRQVRLMPYLTENTAFVPKPGDYVILHSFYTPRIGFVDRHLVEQHDAEVLHEDQSMVVPLLTDVMENPALQNRIAATAFRFQPQFFRSRVYLIRK